MFETEGFILSRQFKDRQDGQELIFWLVTDGEPLQVVLPQQPSVFFIAESDLVETIKLLSDIKGYTHEAVKLKTFSTADAAVALYFPSQRELYFARTRLENADISAYEADLRPTDRYLMERFIMGAVQVQGRLEEGSRLCIDPKLRPSDFKPRLKVISLDIETSYTENILYSIAVYGATERTVMMVSDIPVTSQDFDIECFPDEGSLITGFLTWVAKVDPDVIIGWSVVAFDLHFLQVRCDALGIDFCLGRSREKVIWRTASTQRRYALVPGRVVLDGIELLKTATFSFESFSLDYVARQLLGEGKLVDDVDARAAEIQDMYAHDRGQLAAYNLQDCRLVWDIFEKTDLINFSIERSVLTGLDLDRPGGSVAAFDFLYLPRLHREGFVAPTAGETNAEASPGGFVLDSKAGLYEHVIVLDFKSLYPSIIRTFHVDPLAMITAEEDAIPGFKGGTFSRDRTILPNIIERLWLARDKAKQDGDGAMSQAIKIIMNSFYGVLGTSVCRFFDGRLASSITMRGHDILRQTQDLIEERGFSVIYGDTDSVFVHMSNGDVAASATELVSFLNEWWRNHLQQEYAIDSYLELEYETHFARFLMPTVRGSEKGSKKRYAGLVSNDGQSHLVFKGLETVRSDWTPLARDFQQELYRRIFLDEPYVDYVKQVVNAVQNGEVDSQLVLRRRMRRKIDDYVKNVPPHVRAARIARDARASRGLPEIHFSGSWVEYLMTLNGPEPKQYVESRLDYNFYVERQLRPIADAILSFKSTSLGDITDRQLSLF
jgi:DNA polymerase-2